MKWRGIRRQSLDVSTTSEEGLLAVNTRFKVEGEMRRRRGLARTSIQKKNAAVTNLSGFSAFQSNVMAALTDGDRIQGYLNPYALWGDNLTLYVRPDVLNPTAGFELSEDLEEINGGTDASTSGGGWAYTSPDEYPGIEGAFIYVSTTGSSTLTMPLAMNGGGNCSVGLFVIGTNGIPASDVTAEVDFTRFRITYERYGDLTIYDQAGSVVYLDSNVRLNPDIIHLLVVFEDGNITVYKNGVSVATAIEGAFTAISQGVMTYPGTTFGWFGICDVFAWDFALSETEAPFLLSRDTRPWA